MRRGRALLSVIAVAALLALACVAAQGQAGTLGARAPHAPAAPRLDRATVDRADDIQGLQIHFLYVVPTDGVDRQLDTNGTLDESVARMQQWLIKQTGSLSLRVDTFQGAPDITFVRLPHSDAQATSIHPWPIWVIGEDLAAAGFRRPDKVYAVFYDGHSTWACGARNRRRCRGSGRCTSRRIHERSTALL